MAPSKAEDLAPFWAGRNTSFQIVDVAALETESIRAEERVGVWLNVGPLLNNLPDLVFKCREAGIACRRLTAVLAVFLHEPRRDKPQPSVQHPVDGLLDGIRNVAIEGLCNSTRDAGEGVRVTAK